MKTIEWVLHYVYRPGFYDLTHLDLYHSNSKISNISNTILKHWIFMKMQLQTVEQVMPNNIFWFRIFAIVIESALYEENSARGRGGQHSGGWGGLFESPRGRLCPTITSNHPEGFDGGSCANQVCVCVTGSHGKPEQVPRDRTVYSHTYVRWGLFSVVMSYVLEEKNLPKPCQKNSHLDPLLCQKQDMYIGSTSKSNLLL